MQPPKKSLGLAALEYALIIAAITVILIAAFKGLGDSLTDSFTSAKTELQNL